MVGCKVASPIDTYYPRELLFYSFEICFRILLFLYVSCNLHLPPKDTSPPPLKNELVVERNASIQIRPSLEALKRESLDLESQIRQLQASVYIFM